MSCYVSLYFTLKFQETKTSIAKIKHFLYNKGFYCSFFIMGPLFSYFCRFPRRDSDHSSDTDPGPGPGGFGGGTGKFGGGGSSRGGRDNDRDQDKGGDRSSRHSPKSKENRPSGGGGSGGKQNGMTLLGKRELSDGELNHMDKMSCKISNISIGSTLSSVSTNTSTTAATTTTSCSKYILEEKTEDKPLKSKVYIINEEYKYKGKVIHVRSKEFSDLIHRFSHNDINPDFLKDESLDNIAGFSAKDILGNVKFRRHTRGRSVSPITVLEEEMSGCESGQEEGGGERVGNAKPARILIQGSNINSKCCSVT